MNTQEIPYSTVGFYPVLLVDFQKSDFITG